MKTPTENDFNLWSTDQTMAEKSIPISDDFVPNGSSLLKCYSHPQEVRDFRQPNH